MVLKERNNTSMADTHTIQILLPLPEGREPKQCTKAELAVAMDAELGVFNKHMNEVMQDPLVPAERTLLREYLAWKILHAEGQTSSKD
jgi:hypothetical protein